jgi:hypothetical protein
MSGLNDFAPFLKINGCFIVKNIANPPKTLFIFNYPIPTQMERDLLAIPGVAEDDLRASLLKGELNHKLLYNQITVVCSDIDLLQFNAAQKSFLQSGGIVNGLSIDDSNFAFLHYEDIELIGAVDDVNTIFEIPNGQKFIQNGSTMNIIAYKNGVRQRLGDDYFIAESGGPGTGFDTVILSVVPTTTPPPVDVITADYYVANEA